AGSPFAPPVLSRAWASSSYESRFVPCLTSRSCSPPSRRCSMAGDPAMAARAALDAKTKPRGSLGRLEDLAVRIAEIRGTPTPGRLRAAVVVAAADHGVAAQGVSAYPQEVTAQMLANFDSGGAALCVLSRMAGADLRVYDLGVGAGTADMTAGPAMTSDEARDRLERGGQVAAELAADGFGVVALGEM